LYRFAVKPGSEAAWAAAKAAKMVATADSFMFVKGRDVGKAFGD
jgi:hypothetical protein